MVDQVVGASVVVSSMLMHMGSVHTFVDPWCVTGTLKWRFPSEFLKIWLVSKKTRDSS